MPASDPLAPAAGAVVDLTTVVRHVRSAPPRLGATRLICVDGPSGSGKTVLAKRLAAAASRLGPTPPVVQLDDLYEGWSGLDGVGERLESWLLAPLRAGRPGCYRRYDWGREEYAEWHDVPVAPLVILEGVGAAASAIEPDANLLVWVEAPRALRFDRGIERDGEAYRPHWEAWAAAEDKHFARERTAERAQLRIDGAPSRAYDPESQVVTLG